MILKPEELLNHIIGGYQLESIIGRGAAGTVFLGIHTEKPEEKVAIKVLMPPAQLSEEELLEFHKRFLREAQVLQQLRHPHILTVYDYGEDKDTGLPYMVMQYIDGGTLSAHISKGPMSLQESATITNQVAEALDYAHARNVVHRDIKPANVLLDSSGAAYLADFGIVKLFDSTRTTLTTAGQVMGTPEFMAPEQAQGKAVGPSADVYSLGMVIYQMTTSQLPFVGNSLVDILLQIVQTQPRSPLMLRPDMPKPVEAVIMRALDKDPAKRFTTAGELSKTFELATQNKWAKGLSSYDPMPTESGARPIWEPATINPQTIHNQGRSPGFVIALTLLLVFSLIFALWSKNIPNGVFAMNNSPTIVATKSSPILIAQTNSPTSSFSPTNTAVQQGNQPPPVIAKPTDTPLPGVTPMPANTPLPGVTPVPTDTPLPGVTPVPANTPLPGVTPVPTTVPTPVPTTQPLFAPGLISPPSNMTYVTFGPGQAKTLTFQWSTSAPQSDFAFVSGPYGASDTGWLSYTTSVSYPLGAGNYSWRVKVGDGNGNQSSWSSTWSFSILDPTPTPIPPTPTSTPCPYLPGGNGVTFYSGQNYSGQSWNWYVPAGQNSTVVNLPGGIAGNLGSFYDSNSAWHVVLYQAPNGTGNLGHYDTSVPNVGTYWQATQSVKIYINRSC